MNPPPKYRLTVAGRPVALGPLSLIAAQAAAAARHGRTAVITDAVGAACAVTPGPSGLAAAHLPPHELFPPDHLLVPPPWLARLTDLCGLTDPEGETR